MAWWWITEAVPIAVTALVPLVLFPLLGVLPIDRTASSYANPVIFLFLGGFVVALAMQRHGLHKRIALRVVRAMGVRPHMLVLGMMVATAFISFWVSNTATAIMMFPIGLSIVKLISDDGDVEADADGAVERAERSTLLRDANFATCLMLGVAYAANIGGVGTLIGTPPNALFAAFMLDTYGREVGFAQWMMVGVPLVVVSLPIAWLVLTRVVFPIGIREIPGGAAAIEAEYEQLGRVTRGEKIVAVIFVLAALLWMTRPLLDDHVRGLSDTTIAIGAAIATFIVPVNFRKGEFTMDWRTAEQLPWGVLILFGGGLALADAVTDSGLAEAIGMKLTLLHTLPPSLVIMFIAAVTIFFSEVASNTAAAATFLPLVGVLALALGVNPFVVTVPMVLGASCAFMLPVGTPPNAIAYSSGYVTVQQMARAGLWLNLLFIVLITLVTHTLVIYTFGI